MSKNVSVRLTWNWGKIRGMEQKVQQGLVRMGYDIANEARNHAPYLTGTLSNSIRVEDNGGEIDVIAGGQYGGKDVRYAAIQEFGGNAGKGGKVHITGKHYMENARNLVMSGDYLVKYFGGIAR